MEKTTRDICAEQLIKLRKEKGYTQRKIAEELYMDAKAYGKYERGETVPSIEIICKLAKIYNTTTDYILTGKVPDFNKRFADYVENCPFNKQGTLLRMVRLFVEAMTS